MKFFTEMPPTSSRRRTASAGRRAAPPPAAPRKVAGAHANRRDATQPQEDVKLVGALAAGLRVVRYLTRAAGPVGVSQLARDLELNPSTCFNLLKTLVHEGLVRFDTAGKTYAIGLGLVELARGALEAASHRDLVRPHLEAIAARHRVTASLWEPSGADRVVMVDRVDSSSPITLHMAIGQRLPAYVAALGRCMAAYSDLGEGELRRRFDELRWQDPPSFERYWADVQQVRRRGYAIDDGHFVRGVTTISVPVLDAKSKAVMAISAVGFSAQFKGTEQKALCEDMRQRATEISSALTGVRGRSA
jgi:DNA-binding IclR family transcriptional regulator